MPAFDHERITWTAHGPFGLGDMEGRTYFYFGYDVQFSLPGTVATWSWLGPVLIVATLVGFGVAVARFTRYRRARHSTH